MYFDLFIIQQMYRRLDCFITIVRVRNRFWRIRLRSVSKTMAWDLVVFIILHFRVWQIFGVGYMRETGLLLPQGVPRLSQV